MKGLVTSMFDWLQHPLNSDGNIMDWFGAVILIMILAFLWSTVVAAMDRG